MTPYVYRLLLIIIMSYQHYWKNITITACSWSLNHSFCVPSTSLLKGVCHLSSHGYLCCLPTLLWIFNQFRINSMVHKQICKRILYIGSFQFFSIPLFTIWKPSRLTQKPNSKKKIVRRSSYRLQDVKVCAKPLGLSLDWMIPVDPTLSWYVVPMVEIL